MRKMCLAVLFLLVPLCLAAQCTSAAPVAGTTSGGAPYVIYMPSPASCYNGDMVLFAHGYVPVGSPAGTWEQQLNLLDGTSLPGLLNSLGFGFAASGFSKDGLAILQGIQDTKNLVTAIGQTTPVHKYFITGASEGGLIAALSVETDPTYSGGVAVCGPLGSFQKQINYFGDVRVLFDYFFPGILTSFGGTAVNIPSTLMAAWPSLQTPITKAINSNPLAALQLINVAQIPIGLNLNNAAPAILDALWYNVFATNDANSTLQGNPYGNTNTVYKGSLNDKRLNAMVARFSEGAGPLANVPKYETTGRLHDPLVTLHTTADPVVPFWQETLYNTKVQSTGSSSELVQIPAIAFGHCNVTAGEAEAALLTMLLKAGL
jgi:hypothetical protein